MPKRWYVVQTKSQQERLAVAELEAQRFKAFCPEYLTIASQKIYETRYKANPLFPGYVFVKFDRVKDIHWGCINYTRGCIGLLGIAGDNITAVPKSFVETLQARSRRTGYLQLEPAVKQAMFFKSYVAGEKCMILDGMFKDQVATYCNHSANRVQLLITLLGKPLDVVLPITAVAQIPL